MAAVALMTAMPLATQASTEGIAAASIRPAIAASPATWSLIGDGETVKTTNGVSWVLTVGAQSSGDLSVELARQTTTGGTSDEIHAWDFQTTATTFKFSAGSGVGTIDSGTQASPSATVDVTFKATSHVASVCTNKASGGAETTYTGTLNGEAVLVTGLTGGGTVGGKTLTFPLSIDGSHPTLVYDDNCELAGTFPCPTTEEVIYSASPKYPSPLFLEGGYVEVSGKTYDLIALSHTVSLVKVKGATRNDLGYFDAPVAKWDVTTRTLTVTTSTAGLITGSATLVGSKPSSFSFPCTLNGKSTTTTETSYTADFSSPAGHAMTSHNALGGSVVFPTSLVGSDTTVVNIDTVAAK
jgi:hypothetical protein